MCSHAQKCAKPPARVGVERPEVGLPEAVKKGRQQAAIDAAKEEKKPLKEHGANQHGEDGTKTETVPSSTSGGNSSTRRIRRLLRDKPEVVDRLRSGEFKSVAAAERWARGEDPHPKRNCSGKRKLLFRQARVF